MNTLLSSLFFAAKISTITLPDVSENHIEKVACGVRPYREKGIRIEKEILKDKVLIHHYGHGGSGVCLSWGSSQEAMSLIDDLPRDTPVGVIGSGVIGLTSAVMLLEKGHKVTIYAADFPPHTTSNIAPAIWGKVLVTASDSSLEKEKLERIQDCSFDRFYSLAQDKKPLFKGARIVNGYSFKNSKRKLMEKLPKAFHKDIEKVEIDFHGKSRRGYRFNTLIIDTEIYLKDIVDYLKKQGVTFIKKRFENKEEIAELNEKILFNCLGYGAKELFSDESLTAVKGELIYFQSQENIDYFLSGPLPKPGIDLYLIPLKNKLVLGGSYEMGIDTLNVDIKVISEILDGAKKFLNEEKR